MSNEPVTLTNPETGETWTSGKRGRLPKWVEVMRENGTVIPRAVPASKKVEQPTIPGALRVWKYVGQTGEDGDADVRQNGASALIIAKDRVAALTVANPTFRSPISGSEMDLMWRELDDESVAVLHSSGMDVTKPAIYQSTGKEMQPWEARKPLTSAIN
jgi:hypothetical protein